MYSEINANKRRTVLLMFIFVSLISLVAFVFSKYYGNPIVFVIAIIASVVYALFSYFNADKMAVAANGAVQIEKKDNPRFYRIIENLAITNGMPMPKVYIMDDPAPNAFATGRDPDHALVCATTGILEIMSDSEMEGVMAHELGHVKNYDIRVMMIVVALVGVIAFVSDIFLRMNFWGFGRRNDDNKDGGGNAVFAILAIVVAVLAPLAAALIQLAISRKREYLADATSALTTRHPEALASALEKIQHTGSALKRQNTATSHLFIANPLKGSTLSALFSTHPPLEDRIAKLREMGSRL